MKRVIVVIVSCLPIFVNAQTGGIQFQTLSNWEQVKTKAKKENKYIFIDFYATWCGPCKVMDKDVFTSPNIGALANEKFICIRIQQDKTPSDNDMIRSWYSVCDSLTKAFNISALPTMLFLSQDGKIVNKKVGYQDTANLMTLFNNTLTTTILFEKQLDLYRRGDLAYTEMANLALRAKEMGDIQLADSVVTYYKNNYLYRLCDSLLLTKENLKFILSFSFTSDDKVFDFFYKNPKRGDELTRPGYSRDIVKYIISKEEIDNKLFHQGKPLTRNPDWRNIRKSIEDRYGLEYANSLICPAVEIEFYRKAHDWKKYAKLIDAAIKKYPPETNGYKFANVTMTGNFFQRDDWNLNSAAWDIFLYCKQKPILRQALRWSDLSIELAGNDNGINPTDQYYDTKANLLYKIGKIKEAISTEEKAYEIAKYQAKKNGIQNGGEGYWSTIKEMRDGVPTWNTKN